VKEYSAESRKLRQLSPLSPRIDWYSRFVFLDSVQSLARSLSDKKRVREPNLARLLNDTKTNDSVDCNAILKWGNGRFDQLVVAANSRDAVERRRIVKQITEEFEKDLEHSKKLSNQLLGVFDGTAITNAVRNVLFAQCMPAVDGMGEALQRAEFYRLATPLAFALKAYRLDRGHYPKRLEDLVPAYYDRVPIDPFSTGPVVYRAEGNGFILYSLGPNQKADGGVDLESSRESGVVGDDVVIQLPGNRKKS
jgi:hypothetical protein